MRVAGRLLARQVCGPWALQIQLVHLAIYSSLTVKLEDDLKGKKKSASKQTKKNPNQWIAKKRAFYASSL